MKWAVNIGGGPDFRADGWINLDAFGAEPFVLSPTCKLPIESGSLELVYSSHTLEHLDDATVARVLAESRRVLKPGGTLLIKLPDFDAILAAYRRNDASYFAGRWGLEGAVVPTLGARGMRDTIETRTAYLFCGFWNEKFGHLFGRYDASRPGAYNGPPVMTGDEQRAVLALGSPHAIAADLRARVLASEPIYFMFNHENAWSKMEFADLLADHGFALLDCDAERITANHRDVPGLKAMREISAYYDAVAAC